MIDRITEQPFCQTRVSGSTFYNADCFDVFPLIKNNSIDAIICDLPYGTTQNKWDSVLPLDKLWVEYKRILKPNGVVLLFGAEPFSSVLRLSNLKQYKYDWYWVKNKKTGFLNARKMPMQQVESISVFKDKIGDTYNPIKELRTTQKAGNKKYGNTPNYGKQDAEYVDNQSDYILPANVLNIKTERGLHPTQKPVELMEYLVKTYTNEGDMVLDNCMGSGTTNLACIKLNRKSIGIEKEKQYYDVAVRRASDYLGSNIYKNIQSKENYDKLLSSGMFWEFHPELSGNWDSDKVVVCQHCH